MAVPSEKVLGCLPMLVLEMPKKGIIFQHETKINFENDGRKGKIECEDGGETTS